MPGGDGWLLQDISVQINPGERITLAGPSGSGKTLLLRALALLDPIDEGTILWNGHAIGPGDIPQYRSRVIYVHQHVALFEGTVESNLQKPFTLSVHKHREFQRQRIAGWLTQLGLDEHFLKKSSQDLSGGESQIVALLRAIQLDPDVLLLDEPTSAIDQQTASRIETLTAEWHEQKAERASIWVSHNRNRSRRSGTRCITMGDGRVV